MQYIRVTRNWREKILEIRDKIKLRTHGGVGGSMILDHSYATSGLAGARNGMRRSGFAIMHLSRVRPRRARNRKVAWHCLVTRNALSIQRNRQSRRAILRLRLREGNVRDAVSNATPTASLSYAVVSIMGNVVGEFAAKQISAPLNETSAKYYVVQTTLMLRTVRD